MFKLVHCFRFDAFIEFLRIARFVVIAGADVERIVRTVDFDALQDNILNITFCDIENELVRSF